jgi:predicted nucleotidyltransferase
MNSDSLLSNIKTLVQSDYPSAEVILFGSRSRHEENADSDWDILVIVEKDISEKEKIAINYKIFDVEIASGEVINAIIHTRKEWNSPLLQAMPFYTNVMNEGVFA